MTRRTIVVALLCVLVAAGVAAAGTDPWHAAKLRLAYPIFEPTNTLGYKISGFGFQPCPGGKSKASVDATYGTYKGILLSKTKGFGIFEGSPQICSNPATFTIVGTPTIGGIKATLGVYCDETTTCRLSQGLTNGYILVWRRGKTKIQMDASHLTLAKFLQVARSLKTQK
jgi:hypothetical protein